MMATTTSLLPGVPVSILSHTNNGRTGTFEGLPDGTRFIASGYVLTIRYTPYGVELTSDETYIWDGDGSGNIWTTPANWVGDFAPVANMDRDLIFPADVTKPEEATVDEERRPYVIHLRASQEWLLSAASEGVLPAQTFGLLYTPDPPSGGAPADLTFRFRLDAHPRLILGGVCVAPSAGDRSPARWQFTV